MVSNEESPGSLELYDGNAGTASTASNAGASTPKMSTFDFFHKVLGDTAEEAAWQVEIIHEQQQQANLVENW